MKIFKKIGSFLVAAWKKVKSFFAPKKEELDNCLSALKGLQELIFYKSISQDE